MQKSGRFMYGNWISLLALLIFVFEMNYHLSNRNRSKWMMKPWKLISVNGTTAVISDSCLLNSTNSVNLSRRDVAKLGGGGILPEFWTSMLKIYLKCSNYNRAFSDWFPLSYTKFPKKRGYVCGSSPLI
jgi:hypothetical protein